ncbi:helix-turn-helix transcriptional regulator [uncultured Treponema sp.]|uniref:helix-turn-helix domain-containing protein n=2 Tax=Treponema TaxID=157 RepID=UPI002632973F|nr:helix-turn-helix transcriptional regulator [uncultured Treponema sp.]
MSEFWKRVDEELEYNGMNRKTLSREVGFSLGNVGKGIKLGSSPSADTAVKIASVLGVSVEYLVTGENKSSNKNIADEQTQLKLYRKYHELIAKCERLPEEQVKFLVQIAERLEK